MSGEDFIVRTTITGVDEALIGKTLFDVFGDEETPYYVERDDNENVHNEFADGYACGDESLPFEDYENLICGENVLTFNDQAACSGPVFAIGGEFSRAASWPNCAGWPDRIEWVGPQFPNVLRVWTR